MHLTFGINDNMTTFHANSHRTGRCAKSVLFVVYPNIVLLDLSGPLQVFTHARETPQSEPHYRTSVASLAGGAVSTNTIIRIDSDPLENWLNQNTVVSIDTLVIVGGDGAIDAALDPEMVSQVAQVARKATRVCSVCSGAILLAATGLLDGRRAVTHWEDCDLLAARYPAVNVETDPIYVKDGNIWTSAGITAGVDMALAIVQEDLGAQAAIDMARSLVTPMIRSGGQSQFSADLIRQSSDTDGLFTELHRWLTNNLDQQITVEVMAGRCAMSPRTFSRRYVATMGVPPAKAVEAMRVEAARDLLATTDHSMKSTALRCGFRDQERMRRAFHRTLNVSPSLYKSQFRL
ncbi:GlxA family transcriptional regulator [Nisaea sp.]|uniref:GlxA family transcriptional regulator n=2 Tax=Nisaea sp. TaxID=2024842 RepID=UPI00326346AB